MGSHLLTALRGQQGEAMTAAADVRKVKGPTVPPVRATGSLKFYTPLGSFMPMCARMSETRSIGMMVLDPDVVYRVQRTAHVLQVRR